MKPTQRAPALLAVVFVIATCGLIYELVAGALASYVLGDSITQFSTVIGVYLSAMGLGAWLSKFIDRELAFRFIEVEIAVALVGGCSAAFLFLAFAHVDFFRLALYGTVLVIGTLVGLEIPLLMRILKSDYSLKDLVAQVLTLDYAGALLASLAFPILIVPKLGLIRGAFAVGLINAVVALWSTYVLAGTVRRPGRMVFARVQAIAVIALLGVGFAMSDRLTALSEESLFPDPIVFAKTSPYQRIVMTRAKSGFQLYLNGNLQFASSDEHRYHEALVHPAFAAQRRRGAPARRVLVLGGGDGLAVREVLKHPVDSITVVDLDPVITELAVSHPFFLGQNEGALKDSRVNVVNQDAMRWLRERGPDPRPFDIVFIDFPDPNNFSLGKLYTTRFYRLLRAAMHPHSVASIQATSPLVARRSFWCINETLTASGFHTHPFHATVPAFGEWGYILASPEDFEVPETLAKVPLRFLTDATMLAMFSFPLDMAPLAAEANRLNNQILVQYYEDEWSRVF